MSQTREPGKKPKKQVDKTPSTSPEVKRVEHPNPLFFFTRKLRGKGKDFLPPQALVIISREDQQRLMKPKKEKSEPEERERSTPMSRL